MSQVNDKAKRTQAVYVSIFFLLVIGIAGSGYFFYYNYQLEFRNQAEKQISAISVLKVDELDNWRKELLGDAGFLFHNPAFSTLVERYLKNSGDVDAQAELINWMENYQTYEQFDSEHLLDVTGAEILSVPAGPIKLDSHIRQDAIDCLLSGEITFLDFHRDADASSNVHLAVLVPIFAEQKNNRPLGVLVLTIDPWLNLYPSLQVWPIANTSAETLLIRREGNDVLYLNELRFTPNAAMNLRFPLTNTDLLEVKAVLGQTGIVEGTDYRGEPVLANIRAVPDSSWFLVSKMDNTEINAPLRTRVWEIFGLISFAILAIGTSLLSIWRQQRLLVYRSQAKAVEVLRESEEKFRSIIEYATDGVVLTDEGAVIVEWNPAMEQILGVTRTEALGKLLFDVQLQFAPMGRQNPASSQIIEALFEKILSTGEIPERMHEREANIRRSNGTERVIHTIIFSIKTLQGFRIASFVRDITERKQAENMLARANLRLQSLRMIDHALLGAGTEDGSADKVVLLYLAALIPCSNINIIELNERSDSARVIAQNTEDTLSESQMGESILVEDLRLEEMKDKELLVIKLEVGNLNPLEKRWYDAGERSLVKAPLIVRNKLAALLVLVSNETDFFTSEYLEIIKDVSTQLAVSLHQKNLLNEIRRHAEELEKRVQERTAEIESTNQRLALAINAGEIGVWEIDFKENKVTWDDRMYFMYGMTHDNFDNSLDTWWKMIHPQDLIQSQKRFQEVLHQTGPFVNENRIVRPDGSVRHLSASGIILYDANQKRERMIGVNMDVTNRKKMEEVTQRANLEMARVLRIKDEFLANMSHELRTPLNAVMGISESLLEQTIGPLNEKQKNYLSTINESGAHLLSLINDILDLSKIEAGQIVLNITNVSVKVLFESSYRMIKEMAQQKKITVSFEADEVAQNVRGDSRRLLQMLVNLLSNAVKFTPDGGKIGVQVRADPDQKELNIIVWDTGIGIAEEDMPRLFQSFIQLDSSLSRKYSGTGLGLMLVMKMARMHGGSVSVQSKLNEGSRFTISLPWTPGEQDASEKKKIKKAAPSLPLEKKRTGTILLIDDTESVIMLLRDYLQNHGYQILTASDGLSGVEMAKKEHPDLILMDIQIPGINGFEATKQIRSIEALSAIPIIALTAQAMPGDRERCLAAGMNDYISKPTPLTELTNTIEHYLRQNILPKKGFTHDK